MLAKKTTRRRKIRYGIRRKLRGTAQKPRLSVFRSNKSISVQIIDDLNGHTLGSVTSKGISGNKTEQAKAVGQKIADIAKGAGVENVVFDRGGYLYHGRVKALAEAAREGGLKF